MTNIPSVEERVWRKVEKELEYVATYASPERRVELLAFLKEQFLTALTADRTALLTQLREWAEEIKRCNSSEEHSRRRDHATKSGYEIALDGLQAHLDELIKTTK